jgi:hypothetical protein
LRASRTEFQAYQFKPLLKFLRSSKQRLLLADEVGLGKTIEAGFILCEMLARHPHTFRRALIVCKASLCIKWQVEMRKRFDLQFDIWKAAQLRDFLELLMAWMAVSKSFRRHPLYEETLRMLAESDPASRRATVEIQRNLAEMNFLSRVFSRTRRRDVHIGTERVAVVNRVDMTEAERGLYDAVLGFVRATYRSL